VDATLIVAPPAARPQLVTELPKASERTDYAFQASLFGPQDVAKGIPSKRKLVPTIAQPRIKRTESNQEALDFTASLPEGARTFTGSIEPAVFGDAPVAIPTHRLVAAALDISIVLMCIGVFLATFHFAGYEIVLSKQTVPAYATVTLLISLFYRLIFCIGQTDSLGMHWTGLHLLNFDGRRATAHERLCRTAGACVSVIALGVGFVWALFVEERLSWHDHISKTFPSPRNFNN
jgi:uncharacterized RDD family membrane protein YckC